MSDQRKNPVVRKQNRKNMLLAALLGQIGVLTLVIVLTAAFGGLALDARLGTKPWFTIGLLIGSIPVSILIMVWIARKTVAKIKAVDSEEMLEEESIGKS
jgi:NhaP-type Na+/H+ or K+/H+ antiporter